MTFHEVPGATDPAGLSNAVCAGLWRNLRFLQLERWCAEGGVVDWGTVEIVNICHSLAEGFIDVSGSIYFTEISRGGCADTEIHEEREAMIRVRIDPATGTAFSQ